MGTEDDRNRGGVDELAALKVDQDPVVSSRSLEGRVQLVGHGKVDLPRDLDLAAIGPEAFLSKLEMGQRHLPEQGLFSDGRLVKI